MKINKPTVTAFYTRGQQQTGQPKREAVGKKPRKARDLNNSFLICWILLFHVKFDIVSDNFRWGCVRRLRHMQKFLDDFNGFYELRMISRDLSLQVRTVIAFIISLTSAQPPHLGCFFIYQNKSSSSSLTMINTRTSPSQKTLLRSHLKRNLFIFIMFEEI